MSALIIFNALLTKLAFGFQYSDKVAVAEIYKDGTANPGDGLSKAKSNVSINITQVHSSKRVNSSIVAASMGIIPIPIPWQALRKINI